MGKDTITQRLKSNILILDGAMGTMLQSYDLQAQDFGGAQYEGCNEYLVMTRPDVVREIHEAYLDAGADIIETDTFGGTPLVLAEYGLADLALDINRTAAQIAVEAAQAASTAGHPRYVAGSMGPTTKSLSVTGGATFDDLVSSYAVQAEGLIEGGVDLLLLETSQDLLNVKAGSLGIEQAFQKLNCRVPVMVSGTIEPMGTTLAGQSIEAFYLAVEHMNPLAVGLNCATGPEFMRDHVRALSDLATCAVSCYPNAGLPDEEGHYHETPHSFTAKLADFAEHGWLNIIGGCCGTTPDHIRALAERMRAYAPRVPADPHVHAVSGLEAVFLEEDNRPLIVGERTNVIGSRKFRKLVAEGNLDAASEIARFQVKSGAQVIDICLADPDRDELEDIRAFMPHVVRKVKVPLMIDSTDWKVAEEALKHSQGKAILNSTNLEDGEPRFFRFADLATRFGAALVVGTIDERGMAVTSERKLEIARRSVELLKQRGLATSDLIFDPLTFPVGTGDQNYIGSARETIEGIRQIKQAFPEAATILGVSNVSFGLPPAGREVLNAVFLYHCTKAGLDYAIVNSERLVRFASIPPEERALSERLLFETTDDTVAEFTAFYRQKAPKEQVSAAELPLDERLARYVVEGVKDGLIADLDAALETRAPLDIINGPLMDGMTEVGRLFNNNELIVAEVLQSAEVMKAAVNYLEPKMERTETATKGSILLATVKGDVHDIGKNLVEIILANNGFRVINLGIKVPPETLIEAARQHQPDLIGLSGLLVKSAQQMVVTAEELAHAGIDVPVLVGGAALTKKFTTLKIAPKYAGLVSYSKDAMDGLDLANRLLRDDTREQLRAALAADYAAFSESASQAAAAPVVSVGEVQRSDTPIAPVWQPADLNRHVLRDYPIKLIRPYLNLQMLLGKHLGVRGNIDKLLAQGDEKTSGLLALIDSLIEEGQRDGWLKAHAVYQFFPAASDGNIVRIFDSGQSNKVLEQFDFPRQVKPPYLCLADYVRPGSEAATDYVAFFNVTTGLGIRAVAERLKEQGDYLRAHAVQALALELAEAFAERLHHILRDAWGFPDPVDLTMRERFIARYQGIRVSFGYPACPNLDDQAQLFRLLSPQDIGVQLTDGFMMEPEASVSAMVFSHPEAKYFNVDSGTAAVGGEG